MSISTHVLNATTGRPAAGLELALAGRTAAGGTNWPGAAPTRTGGSPTWPPATAGVHRIVFLTEAYLKAQSPTAETFYPEIVVIFRIADPAGHHDVPLLLSPYAYSTYRGS